MFETNLCVVERRSRSSRMLPDSVQPAPFILCVNLRNTSRKITLLSLSLSLSLSHTLSLSLSLSRFRCVDLFKSREKIQDLLRIETDAGDASDVIDAGDASDAGDAKAYFYCL